jgi:Zn-dependent protease with chaperone function
MLTNPLAKSVLQSLASLGGLIDSLKYVAAAIQGSLRLVLVRWGRAAQINCDRAGVLCCGDLDVAQYALLKLMLGGSERLKQINLDAYLEQFEQAQPKTSSRLLEFGQMHVPLPRRLEAIRLFGSSQLFGDGQLTKEELDNRCEQILSGK